MDTKPINNYLRELKRCDYSSSEDVQPLEHFQYNGVSYAQSSATYQKQMEKGLAEFKSSILALISNTDKSVIKTILDDCIEIEGQYYDIPDNDIIAEMERDYMVGGNDSLLKSIREAKFLNEMVGVQRFYLSEVKKYLSSLCGDNIPKVDKQESETVEKVINSDWLTLDEVCKKFNLPKNNIKDRQWRIRNNFPLGNSAPCKKLTFNAKEIEEWLRKC